MRTFAALTVALLACRALAQGPGDGELRTPPPAPPVREPAMPGESPTGKASAMQESGAPPDNRSQRAASRCAELRGTLREQCLLEQQGAAAGATSVPEPRTAPPPQNPR